ncbi:hypothetical protein H671_2g7985 [Cricetulus griseus]|nr:hypothetical protein H671_2g7985 [Cricetulus griseus]
MGICSGSERSDFRQPPLVNAFAELRRRTACRPWDRLADAGPRWGGRAPTRVGCLRCQRPRPWSPAAALPLAISCRPVLAPEIVENQPHLALPGKISIEFYVVFSSEKTGKKCKAGFETGIATYKKEDKKNEDISFEFKLKINT